MKPLYNAFNLCSRNFDVFFRKIDNSLSKPQINFLSDFFTSLLSSSVNFDKLAIVLSHKYSDIKFDSILKRISRFLNNMNLNFHILFDKLIHYIFSNFKVKHLDHRIFVSFDHMFVKDKFTIFMLSLKVGKQGFPIFFKVFEGKNGEHFGDAFSIKLIKQSLLYVHNLLILISILSSLLIVGLVIFFLYLILLIMNFVILLFLDVKIILKYFIN